MDEEWEFRYSASLRIYGDIVDFDAITKVVGVKPTHTHKRGDRRSEYARPYPNDMWSYSANIDETENLSLHLNALWAAIGQNAEAIKALKDTLTVNVFCGYRSDCDHAGFEVPHQSLTIFQKLEVPFDVSVIVITD